MRERTEDEKLNLSKHLRRIEGQIRGIEQMVNSDRYCIDILTQVLAAEASLKSFSKVLLSAHIHTCVEEDIRAGSEEKVNELVSIIGRMV